MFRKRHPPVGSRPGTLVINSHAQKTAIRVMQYTTEGVKEQEISEVAQLREYLAQEAVVWIDVQGLGDEKTLRSVGDVFGLHPLVLEDVVNVPQRPKIEAYDEHLLCITRMVMLGEGPSIEPEQVSVILGRNYVLTFQERHGDVLDPVRQRIRQGKGSIRKAGADYLAYAVLDAVIDGYYPIMEAFGEYLEFLEDEIVVDPRAAILQKIHRVKRELLAIRRAIWPQREAVNALIRDDCPYLTDGVRMYLRDCYDHCVQIIDVVETYRELAGGLMDVYLSSVANRQNEVMKVLTIMASIFIPLTFMAGVYGMNFQNMPELQSRWGYPLLLAGMVAVAVGLVLFFRRKGWLGHRPQADDADV
ncbi:MAG TPA: magnesium/cobalt transporter CorA [Phycisphaerae bacterium]|nr:magnesium/cobalt transporter CorA [Phycisphaerae bacterium]